MSTLNRVGNEEQLRQKGCQLCRERHLKCDQGVPRCGRCDALNRECLKPREYRNWPVFFARDHEWVDVGHVLTFVDETNSIAAAYHLDGSAQDPVAAEPIAPTSAMANCDEEYQSSTVATSIQAEEYVLSDVESGMSTRSPLRQVIQGSTPMSVNSLLVHESPVRETTLPALQVMSGDKSADMLHTSFVSDALDEATSVNYSSRGLLFNDSSYENGERGMSNSRDPLEEPVWPLKDASEALLLRHYIQKLAIWLDLCDPKRHFEMDVPDRAGTCQVLLNAIFALSSRHLSLVADFDHLASSRYHQECLKFLIPLLDNSASIEDENLFAAIIILRVLEELDDSPGHMLGIQVFVNSRDLHVERGSMSEAAYWVGLRQEIYSALMNHVSIQVSLHKFIADHSIEPLDDFEWANRAIIHCADVINFCFGDACTLTGRWNTLKSNHEHWQRFKPASFTPVYFKPADIHGSDAFPTIWYQKGCHVIGVQHHILAEILLVIYDPTLPRIGGRRKEADLVVEGKLYSILRDICGIGVHNRWTAPGMFTASMAIAICGDRASQRNFQEALLDVLVQTERDHARPTKSIQQQMLKSWGWTDADKEQLCR